MSNPDVASGLLKLFQRRADFIVVGLTGRTGSGCTTAAALLTTGFTKLKAQAPNLKSPSPEERKYRITRDYAEQHWRAFSSISISNVIISYLFDLDEPTLRAFLSSKPIALKKEQLESLIDAWKPASSAWQANQHGFADKRSSIQEKRAFLGAWSGDIQQFFRTVRRGLGPASTKLLQIVGDNLRKSGNPIQSDALPEKFYALPERVAALIELIRHVHRDANEPTYIVLDALRNPFEILYFRERFSAFYLFAMTTENDDREYRLGRLEYSAKQIAELDAKEYPEKATPLSGYDAFTSQNIQSCLEKADVYIRNNGRAEKGSDPNLTELTTQLIRYFALILHPGLVTPTRPERCMQTAFSARANSGCISRQVGAAVTDANDSIKAIGWNDVPAGQVPCLLRRATDLVSKNDSEAFSDYEFGNTKFLHQVQSSYVRFAEVDMGGRPSSFCFKTEYNTLTGEKNQVHTRSLHAEENAFLQIAKHGGDGIQGGRLYTTASPCELCAKKAFQLGIKTIFYIDPYPGISLQHILRSGSADNRPDVILFQGAVGQAYHRLYDPVLPYKDEVKALLTGGPDALPKPAIKDSSDRYVL